MKSQLTTKHLPMTNTSRRLRLAAMAAEYVERVGERIRERRDELGLSRDEVARRMPGSTNGNQVYRWERGKHAPRSDTLEALAGVLEVDVSYFYVDRPDKANGTPDVMGDLSQASDQGVLADVLARLDLIQQNQQDLALLLDNLRVQSESILERLPPTSEQQQPGQDQDQTQAA